MISISAQGTKTFDRSSCLLVVVFILLFLFLGGNDANFHVNFYKVAYFFRFFADWSDDDVDGFTFSFVLNCRFARLYFA